MMEIKKLENIKVKCDFYGCNNMADYTINLKRGIFRGYTDLCKDCLTELYSVAGKILIPQSPVNILKKKKENFDAK